MKRNNNTKLEEAIKHCQEVALCSNDSCKNDHLQLAEWLKELIIYKDLTTSIITKKKSFEANAELKTIADYALILEYVNGFSKKESRTHAAESHGEPLFERLLGRNIELFRTGTIIFM